VILETDDMTADQVVERLVALVEQRRPEEPPA
jgi:hypothetical protein